MTAKGKVPDGGEGASGGKVARFPPLPPIPDPVGGKPDPRQDRFRSLAGRLSSELSRAAHVATANISSGYCAASVDLGALQEMIESALANFQLDNLGERWRPEVRPWIQRALLLWVQRCKVVRAELRGGGVHVHLETQDDAGYYSYDFDAFPGRGHRRRDRSRALRRR